MKNQSKHFVLSSNAKPRLKWTHDLHQRFIEATNQLGGAETTPKSLMRLMGIPGLTLYHLKSHLQKYRLGKSQQLEKYSDNKQEDYTETKSFDGHCSREISLGENQINENMHIADALEMQMEVEKKLYEQIEVQKHLQLRIEAQGKYLQSVLSKAHEALSTYNSSSIGIKLKKSELSQLVIMINNACPNSPISEVIENGKLSLNSEERKMDRGTICSLESSLISCESSKRKEEKHSIEGLTNSSTISLELPLMTMQSEEKSVSCLVSESVSVSDNLSNETNERKRNAATESDGNYIEQCSYKKRCGNKMKKEKLSKMFDLNRQCENEMDSTSSKILLDLNCSLIYGNHEDGL
ncbi:myb family transcription factor PHL8-like isoform X2 [Cicer arietinum]|uniref:Myb family transcription factor PHL8-like isoform X2 n=1 Tax=Cicer arietinum TaxID=3827 RepID=A0A1S2XKK8_CICAR|nr:myb family transcription factor PHL8-like isoform X2 [Cicer arietinum]